MSFDQFVRYLDTYVSDGGGPVSVKKTMPNYTSEASKGAKRDASVNKPPPDEEEDGDEEEEELPDLPDDMRALSKEEQQRKLKVRAGWMMMLGTVIVLAVSDPFVDVLNRWGGILNVPAFYVSFVVAPFASNASELLAAYTYAAKKTKTSITTSLSQLIGAACMNNTFVLAIFFALLFFKGLAWRFTAETVSIMLVQWLIAGIAITKTTHTLAAGFVIFACYPLCLFVVYILESPLVGLD